MSLLQALGPLERGLLFGLDRLGASVAALDGLDEASRAACEPAWRAWCESSAEDRELARQACAAEISAPWPTGIEALHPSWIREALSRAPADLVPSLAAGLPESVRVASGPGSAVIEQTNPVELADLQRALLVALEPLCNRNGGPLAEQLSRLSFDGLQATIMRWGAWAVGRSLYGSDPIIRARALSAVGEPWAAEIAAASSRPVSEAERARARVLTNATSAAEARTPEERLLAVGLASLHDALSREGEDSLHQVAGRLPAALGRRWLGW